MSRVRSYVLTPLREFLATEAAGGVVLLLATLAALAWANGPWGASYAHLWEKQLGGGSYRLPVRDWIGDGLMTVFFFVVGLEIKRELVTGELRDPRKAALPVVAALGGMAGPAIVFMLLNAGGPHTRGWGIPVATDIAFSVGVLIVLGHRVPGGLKIFLLTLAIADDIGGIVVIALFYTGELSFGWLSVAGVALILVASLKLLGAGHPLVYLPLGVLAWAGMFQSGIHPTIAGVGLGLLTPARPFRGRPVLEEIEHRLHPLSSFLIVPIFALANAGVAVDAPALGAALRSRVFWGVALGLLVGKMIGISAATAAALKIGIGRLPRGVRAPHMLGVAALGGVGFTVALFITGLAFRGEGPTDVAKVGVLAGSVVSALVGSLLLLGVRRPPREPLVFASAAGAED